jgi:hypothetical protein
MEKNKTFRFKVGDRIFYREEVFTVQKLTEINGWAAYFVNEMDGKVADHEVSAVPVPVFED